MEYQFRGYSRVSQSHGRNYHPASESEQRAFLKVNILGNKTAGEERDFKTTICEKRPINLDPESDGRYGADDKT